MKRLLIPVVAGISVAMGVACSNYGPRTIEAPAVEAANTGSIDVLKAELTDTATIVTFKLKYRPGWWVRFDSASQLRAGDKIYGVKDWNGVVPGSQIIMPSSGDTVVTLVFEPVPYETKSIDFTEGTEKGWCLWGIDLTGKKNQASPDILAKLPADVRELQEFESPSLEAAPTEIRFHVLGYRPEYGKLNLVFANMADQENYSVSLDANGEAVSTYNLYGTTGVHLYLDGLQMKSAGTAALIPGNPVDLYIDAAGLASDFIQANRGEDSEACLRVYDNGALAAANRVMFAHPSIGSLADVVEKCNWRMTPDEYTDAILAGRQAALDTIESLSVNNAMRNFLKGNVDMAALLLVASPSELYNMYYLEKGSPEGMRDSVAVPEKEQFDRVASLMNLEDTAMLVYRQYVAAVNPAYNAGQLPAETFQYLMTYQSAASGSLSDEQLATFDNASTPFFAKALKLRQATAEEARSAVNQRLASLPEDAPEKIFADIIAPHKGKVVLVDLWNTWCGPCRNALKSNEPLKSGELSDDDIVWVYIADESSDKDLYEKMKPGIKGLHYMVNNDQISAIRDLFNVDGIPYYILVDRHGNVSGHPDFRDHEELVKGIKTALAEK